jgi:hypothetical protein
MVAVPDITAIGTGFTVTVSLAVEVQPLPSVTVTA